MIPRLLANLRWGIYPQGSGPTWTWWPSSPWFALNGTDHRSLLHLS
ncbi:hypothetical protein [Actinomadura sp. HBU206391]|nr:hypothetical protein [Actinomadura sp. HBU206391]MBC6459715.1 hypothetical protein [Actinomadura sp. HBU206391]